MKRMKCYLGIFILLLGVLVVTTPAYSQFAGTKILKGRRPLPAREVQAPVDIPVEVIKNEEKPKVVSDNPAPVVNNEVVPEIQSISPDCDAEFMSLCEKEAKAINTSAVMQCLKRQMKKISFGCQKEAQSQVDLYEILRNTCRGKYLKTCRWDIDKGPVTNAGKIQAISECLLAHWDEYDDMCQEFVRRNIPFFDEIEQNHSAGSWKKHQGKPQIIKISGMKKRVTVVAQEGDVVWYKAPLKQKKMIDQYEFCPDIHRAEGLVPIIYTNFDGCIYEASAPWAKELIEELNSRGLMKEISYSGFRGIMDFLKVYPEINEVINKFSSNCPKGFVIDVINDHFIKKQYVTCYDRDYSCENGYASIHSDSGYFGCQKFATCQDSGEGYVEFGDKKFCAVCDAGGCVDQEKTYPDMRAKLVALCKVNAKNPEGPVVCK